MGAATSRKCDDVIAVALPAGAASRHRQMKPKRYERDRPPHICIATTSFNLPLADSFEPMKVLVDAVSARQGAGLIFLSEQLPALERISDVNLTIIAAETSCNTMRNACPQSRVISWPTRSLPARILREQTAIPRQARAYDLLYSPGNFAIGWPPIPQVLVLQSLWYFGQEARAARRRCSLRMRARLAAESVLARASVRKATRVICVSETLKARVAEDVGGVEKITSIPYAVPELPPQPANHSLGSPTS